MTKFHLFFFSIFIAFSPCKKEVTELPDTLDLFTSPENNVRGANDETARMEYAKLLDIITFAYELDFMKMKKLDSSIETYPCGIETIDTIGGNLNLKFGGTCNSRILSGNVVIEKVDSLDWWFPNSKILARITDFKVRIGSNDEELVFNGYFTIENLYGSLVAHIIESQRVVHQKIRGKLDVKLNNTDSRKWNITKVRKYVAAGADYKDIQLHVTADSNTYIAESGISKLRHEFITSYSSAAYSSSLVYYSCKSQENWIPDFTLTQGQYSYIVGTTTVEVEAGFVDENGYLNAVQNCKSKGLKIRWNFSNANKEAFFEY